MPLSFHEAVLNYFTANMAVWGLFLQVPQIRSNSLEVVLDRNFKMNKNNLCFHSFLPGMDKKAVGEPRGMKFSPARKVAMLWNHPAVLWVPFKGELRSGGGGCHYRERGI